MRGSFAGKEEGFTLVELLIVMLVLSMLAALAIPAFGEQTSKAKDAKAKTAAHGAAVAIETCGSDSIFGYAGCNANALREIDPSLPPNPVLKVNNLSATTYTIVVQSEPSSQKFRIRRNAQGEIDFPCAKKGVAGCPSAGRWDR